MEENKSINRSDIQKNLYNALVESYNSKKDIISSYGDVVTLKRGRDDQDKDEDPSAGSNRGSKRRRSGKEAELSKEPTHKESKSISSSKGVSRSHPKSSGKSAQAEEHGQKVDDLEEQSHQKFNTGNDDATPVRETKAADYGHVKWIEDKVPGRIWSPKKVVYDKHAYWGTYHWGPKRQKFYRYAANMITSKDVYSRHMISKLTNLNLDERYALNVALRMYTRCIVIQELVEDLQLGVESYQKKTNLLRPDSYHDMDRNRLMRTEELHKFSDGTLNHVRTTLNDIATRIQMEYLPKRKWSKQDKQRDRVMINAIDKKLKDRRLMRSLEKFVGGRPYKGDLWLLERTI
ncbi:hypothetical protein Tco_0852620 [Tanacetum coccineum]